MRSNKIVSGGERVEQSPAGGPAFRVSQSRPRSVIRRSGRRPAEFIHAIDWGYCALTLGWAVAVFVTVYVAMRRGR